jgi:integrase
MGTRAIGRLPSLKTKRLLEPGRHCDGGGLYLQVCRSGARSWIFRYQRDSRVRDMGLGAASTISLGDARDLAQSCRAMLARDIDPIEDRQGQKRARRAEAVNAMNIEDCARQCFDQKKAEWRNEKHAKQWITTLERFVFPVIGKAPVKAIDTADVIRVLDPIWSIKNETATRVRERLELVLDWAKARSLRAGENPARWRGHLETLLPKPSAVRKARHHPALPYEEIGAFMASLTRQEGLAARALELLIYTATRTSEALGARWSEFDLDRAIWTIPAERIKAGKEHRIPLSKPALSLLADLHKVQVNEWVFCGWTKKAHLSNMAMIKVLERMDRRDITVHGFRSTFRDWAAERTNFPREVAEMALAHAIESKVEAAYRRGDLFEKRYRLMEQWAAHCGKVQPPAQIRQLESRPTVNNVRVGGAGHFPSIAHQDI